MRLYNADVVKSDKLTLGSAISKMKERNEKFLIVKHKNNYYVLRAMNIIKKGITDITKEDIEDFLETVHVYKYKNIDIEKVIKNMVLSNLPLALIKKNNKLFVLKAEEILIEKKKLLNLYSVADSVNHIEVLSYNDSVLKARRIMLDNNVEEVLVEKNGKIYYVSVIDILNLYDRKKRERFGEKIGESINNKVNVFSLAKDNYKSVDSSENLSNAILLFPTNAVVVFEKGKAIGILSPYKVLKFLILEKIRDLKISNIYMLDDVDKDFFKKDVENFIKKMEKSVRIHKFHVNIDRHRESGSRKKYTIHVNVSTHIGTFYSKSFNWNVFKALHNALEKLEREIKHKLGRMRSGIRGSM